MRQERTVQASIFDLFAKHEIGCELMSVTRDMSGFCSRRFVRFSPEGSHAGGGPDEPGDRCDWAASEGEAELRGGWSVAGDERAAFPAPARRLRGLWGRGDHRPPARACVGPAGGRGRDPELLARG